MVLARTPQLRGKTIQIAEREKIHDRDKGQRTAN
jgi:hypothetical protein